VDSASQRSHRRENSPLSTPRTPRSESITATQDVVPNLESRYREQIGPILGLVRPQVDRDYDHWFLEDIPKEHTLKYHVPRACTKAVDAVMWIKMIVSFIQGAISCDSVSSLRRIPGTTPVVHFFMSGLCSNVPEEWSSEEED
jgi:hypothetical protein